MSIIGNPLITTNYISDSFSGDASTVAFTLSQAPASAASIAVYISGLYQIPTSAYSISGTTLTFTGAPPTGTNNITVLHLGVKSATLVPVNGSVTPQMLSNANVVYWSASNNNVGIGNVTPTSLLTVTGTAALGNTTISGTLSASANVNLDSGTFFVDGTNNRVGINNTAPTSALTVTGNAAFSNTVAVTGAATFSNTVAMGSDYMSPYTGFKNRIINGDMRIAQRGTAPTMTGGGDYSLDRFGHYYSSGAVTTAQSSVAPAGFAKSLLITVSSAASSPTYNFFYQKIEGLNCTDLGFGLSTASSVTLSFWVRSSVTGIYSVSITNYDGDRAYAVQYTINAANTWEQKTITIPGDTTGTWYTTNTVGLYVRWNMGSASGSRLISAGSWQAANADGATGSTGANTWVNTSGATFYITGVQLEKGSTATAFDYRPFGTELQLCQRYYEKSYNLEYVPGTFNVGWDGTSTNGTSFAEGPGPRFKITKRTNPTVVIYNAVSGATARMYQVSTAASITVALRNIGHNGVGIVDYTSSGGQNSYYFQWTADAEL